MKHWFLDTNVLIDFLTNRPPFAAAATDLLRLAYVGRVRSYVASLSFSTAFYLLRRSLTATDGQTASQLAQQQSAQLKPLLTIVAVDDEVVTKALAAGFADYEDALQYFAATSVPAIELLITRNARDFKSSLLPLADPRRALQLA